jgi:hypothetical protein
MRILQKVSDVPFTPGEKIVDAQDVIFLFDQSLAQMRAKKSSTAGDEDLFQCSLPFSSLLPYRECAQNDLQRYIGDPASLFGTLL